MRYVVCFVFFCCGINAFAQYNENIISSDVVLAKKRASFDVYLKQQVIKQTFYTPLDSNSEYNYESACLAVSQFMIDNDDVKAGFDTLFLHYDSLLYSTRRAFIEALYSIYPTGYAERIKQLIKNEKQPKLFSMQAVYLYKNDSSKQNVQRLLMQLQQSFADTEDTLPLLQELKKYLTTEQIYKRASMPAIAKLFAYRKTSGSKTIYSFQRWNRDYPGLAIIQYADGSFARDSAGSLITFTQLAHSASNMPYFISSGSTPQGIYRIWSTAVSKNKIIGPTPNLQMVMPFENDKLYWDTNYDSNKDALRNYLALMPIEWQNYAPMLEAYNAGRAGRSEIIAHGSTIDPVYFKDKPWYPLSPTLGCLCGRELWNTTTGKLVNSDQLQMINTFLSNDDELDETGYMIVVNLNNTQAAVSKEEVQQLVDAFEQQQ